MGEINKKVLFGSLFVIVALSVMFADALFHVDFNKKPSMAFLHAANHHDTTTADHMDMVMTSTEDLTNLPRRGPEDKMDLLPFTEKDGVKEFHLSLEDIMWEYKAGSYVHAWAYNGQVPGPEIHVNEGDKIRVIVTNNLQVPTSVHWHGIHVPNEADGIPGFTQYPIEPGTSYTYEFTATPAGTRFYHTHGSSHGDDSVTQMDMGLYGPFIIEPKKPKKYDHEYTLMLDEWEINPDGSNGALMQLSATGEHVHTQHTYNVFTINGEVYPDVPPIEVKENKNILIRLINAGTQEIHPMHLHGHSFKVVAIDGNPVPKVAQQLRDTITVNPGERYDIEVHADNPGVWLFHCHHLHHAAAGMVVPFIYEGYKPCCMGEPEENRGEMMHA